MDWPGEPNRLDTEDDTMKKSRLSPLVNLSRYSAPKALGANVVRNRSTLC
ncbi:Uncharacterised protein [Mycobacteroides abscessus subsp. abscessus]|nr:Uncharacterised protein [Mycobacteroides abscessus subsp. abscessus]